jgi:hypothetical protein
MRLTDKQRQWLILQEELTRQDNGKAEAASRKWQQAKADLLARAYDNGWPRTVLDEAARNDTDLNDALEDQRYFGSEVIRRSAAIVGVVTAMRAVVESDDDKLLSEGSKSA